MNVYLQEVNLKVIINYKKLNGFSYLSLSLISILLLFQCSESPTKSELKIQGGGEVTHDNVLAKSTVALLDSQGQFFCSGTLITRRSVVTAAHCYEASKGQAIQISFGTNINYSTKIQSLHKFVNKDYNKNAMNDGTYSYPVYDIGLVVLPQPAPSNFVPMPILPRSLQKNEPIYLAGFGSTPVGQVVRPGVGILRSVNASIYEIYNNGEFQFISDTYEKGFCRGDSGGPAAVFINNQIWLIGVASRMADPGYCTGNCCYTGIYTDITRFTDWIERASRAGQIPSP